MHQPIYQSPLEYERIVCNGSEGPQTCIKLPANFLKKNDKPLILLS